VREPPSRADHVLSEQLRKRGFNRSPIQVQRRRKAGLYPPLLVERKGRGHSDLVRYPAGTIRQAVELERLLDQGRTFKSAAIALARRGYPVEMRALRAPFLAEIRRVRKRLSLGRDPVEGALAVARLLAGRTRRGAADAWLRRAARALGGPAEEILTRAFVMLGLILRGEPLSIRDLQELLDLAGLSPLAARLNIDLDNLGRHLAEHASLDAIERAIKELGVEEFRWALSCGAALAPRAADNELVSVALGLLVSGRTLGLSRHPSEDEARAFVALTQALPIRLQLG